MTMLADVVTDTETNGFLDEVTVIHCAVTHNRRTGETFRYGPEDIPRYLADLQGLVDLGLTVAAHNGIKYDVPVIDKLHPDFYIPPPQLFDTLTASRLTWPDIKEDDTKLLKSGKLPGKLWGSHSLKAWGYRLGVLKGEYGEQEDAWEKFTPEMLDYCEQDVVVTTKLLEKIESKNPSPQALKLMHEVSWVLAQQERNGFPFDEAGARDLYLKLIARRTVLENTLAEWFPPWQRKLPDFIPARNNKTNGYLKGVPVPRHEDVIFNPGSRDHIANRLQTLFGWVPVEMTPGGKPKVDEETIKDLPYPPVKDIVEYLLVQKRIGQVGDGDNAWLKLCKKGKIHGSITPNGAVTGRCTHSYPNVGQVPAGGAAYGKECRALFGSGPWPYLVGADASGLELRCLAHFMHRYDGGDYGRILVTGSSKDHTDVHSVNQRAAGLPTRDNAKTFIYAFLYGAGDAKIGSIVGKDAGAGRSLKNKFLKQTPALKLLKDAVEAASKRGYLVGLDKRLIPIRSPHAALNTLLQGAGAVICNQWVVFLHEALAAEGLKHGWDGDYAQVAYVHDEVQIACRTREVAETVARLAPLMVAKAGEHFNFKCPLTGEASIGTNWAETH